MPREGLGFLFKGTVGFKDFGFRGLAEASEFHLRVPV